MANADSSETARKTFIELTPPAPNAPHRSGVAFAGIFLLIVGFGSNATLLIMSSGWFHLRLHCVLVGLFNRGIEVESVAIA